MPGVDAVLLDVDGVLTHSWEPIAGAREAVGWLRREGIPFLLITNTTSHSRASLAGMLRRGGFDIDPHEVVTAPVAAGSYLRSHHPSARCFLLGSTCALEDLSDVRLVDGDADVVLVAGADEGFTFENLNRAFRLVLNGAKLIAMHRSLYWITRDGPTLDAGAYILGLEEAGGVEAMVVGKPSPEFFRQAVAGLGVRGGRVAMVGDDIESDVLAAQAAGLNGVLVRTGKFREDIVARAAGAPDQVIDSVADLPMLIRGS